MKITEIRIFPTKSKDKRLKAYATMTFDDWFVVRNVKVIQGNSGLFVAMPSRKMMDPCPKCGFKNTRGSRFCNECGSSIEQQVHVGDKRQNEHMDIAHPIKQECRVYLQDMILDEFQKEMKRKETEGSAYRPASESDFDEVSKRFSGAEKIVSGSIHDAALDESKDIEL